MTKISERHRHLAAAFTDKVEGVAQDQWDSKTPCEDWTVRDLVGHLAGHTAMMYGFIKQEPPKLPDAEKDPAKAYVAARDAMQAALEDPMIAEAEYEGMFGKTTFEKTVDQFICSDLVLHNWDLSRATGQDEKLEPDEVHAILEQYRPMADKVRQPGVFGPEVQAPAGADEQTQLLAFAGRTV